MWTFVFLLNYPVFAPVSCVWRIPPSLRGRAYVLLKKLWNGAFVDCLVLHYTLARAHAVGWARQIHWPRQDTSWCRRWQQCRASHSSTQWPAQTYQGLWPVLVAVMMPPRESAAVWFWFCHDCIVSDLSFSFSERELISFCKILFCMDYQLLLSLTHNEKPWLMQADTISIL